MSDMAGKAARVAVEPSGSERDTDERQRMSQDFGVSAVEASSRLGNRFVTILCLESVTSIEQLV